MNLHIPTFQDIKDLHHAVETNQSPMLPEFYIYRNEESVLTSRAIMPSHRCNFFQISLDRQSNYSLFVDNTKTDTRQNTIYFVGRGKMISWHSESTKEWKGYNINFKKEFLYIGDQNKNFFLDFPFLHHNSEIALPVSNEEYEQLAGICEKMLYEQRSISIEENILKHYLHIILLSIKRIYDQQYSGLTKNSPGSRELQLVSAFENLVEEKYLHDRSVQYYAKALYISPKYLSQLTNHVYGITAKDMIMQRVLVKAQALLRQTQLTQEQIAATLGFEDASHFVKFFRSYCEMSPLEYRHT